jgi:NADH dehydrogenase
MTRTEAPRIQISATPEPHVLVIGGGFGGLAAVKALRHAPVTVSLIDKLNYNLFQPLLYQVATSTLAPSDIATPLRQIFRDQKNATVFLGEVTAIDLATRTFSVEGQPIPRTYDYLVVAVGAQQSYFGHEDFAAFAPGLKSLSDAEYLRNKILSAFEYAERKLNPSEHPELTTFVLVGGGPTGVELAAAICQMAQGTLASEFRRYDPSKVRVILVQSGSRLLPQFDEGLATKATERLRQLGVEVRLNSRVTAVDQEGVTIGQDRILSRNVIWTAGVAASKIVQSLGLPADKAGRIIVQADCSVAAYPGVFVIGDAASFTPPHGRSLPGVAQVALQQGKYVGDLIERKCTGGATPPPFKYFDKGNLAVIGRFYAIMESFGVRSAGLLAFLVWAFVHLQFLTSLWSRFRTAAQWIIFLLTNQRADRLIIPPKEPDKFSETID